MQYLKRNRGLKWIVIAAMWMPLLGAQSSKPDNTKNNAADRTTGAPTADTAKNDKTDRETMKEIRKALTSDKSLSTDAHNVKVIADHGKVTLRGPVRSEDERKTVEAAALKVAGAGNVDNQMTVKGDTADRSQRDASQK
jgi:osmotically-inducible protein OsmY